MTFDKLHEHFTAHGGVGEIIAVGTDWLTVKNAAHAYAVETEQEVVITKVTVIKAPCLSI